MRYPHSWRIEKELDVLRAVDGQSGVTAGSTESAIAISGGRPLRLTVRDRTSTGVGAHRRRYRTTS